MGVIVNGSYYPSEVVDILTPAEKAAKRAKEQAEQNYQYQIQASQNQMDTFIDPVDTITKTMKGFGDLLSINRSIKAIDKAAKDKKQEATNAELKRLAFSPQDKDVVEAVVRYKNDEKNINATHGDFLKFLATQGNISPQLKQYLTELSAGELLRAAKWIGTHSIATSYQDFTENHIISAYGKTPAESRLKFDSTIGNDPDKVRKAFNDFSVERLRKLGLSKDLITHNYLDSIHEIASTLSGTAASLYKVENLTKIGLDFANNIDAAQDELQRNENALTQVVHETILKLSKPVTEGGKGLDTTEATRQVTSMLVMQVLNKRLSYAEFTDIKRGLNLGNNPAGKTGEVMLSKEQFALIDKAYTDMAANEVKLQTAQRTKEANIAISELNSGIRDAEGRDRALARHIALGGKDTDALYIQIQNTDPNYQTKNVYEQEKPRIEALLSDGTTKVADLTIRNNQLKGELQKEELAKEKWREKNGYHKDNSFTWAKKAVVEEGRGTLKEGDVEGSGSPAWVATFISQTRDRIIHDVFKSGGTKADVEAAVKAELTSLGFYVEPGGFDLPGAGILTPDIEGNFPGYESTFLSTAETKVNPDISLNEIKRVYDKKLYRNAPGDTDKQKLVNSGLAISTPEIVNLASTFREGADGKVTINWTKDILLKSEILGIEPEVLVAGKLKAMIENKNDKAVQMAVKSYGLENLLAKLPQSNVKVRQFLESNQELLKHDSALIAKFEYLGIQNLSQNQLQRIVDLESKIGNFGAEREFTPKQQRAKDIQFYKDNDAAGAVENFNTLYPQNNITIKDIIWNPKTKKWELRLKDRDLIPTIRQG